MNTDLRSQLVPRLGIDQVKSLARSVPALHLFSLVLEPDLHVASNAAWILTHKSDAELALLPQSQLVHIAMTSSSVSVRRLSLAIIERQPLNKNDIRTDFLDYCLSQMVSLDQPCGVQALCMKLAYRQCAFYPELLHEFVEVLKMMHIEHYKPGLTHLINKYLKLLT